MLMTHLETEINNFMQQGLTEEERQCVLTSKEPPLSFKKIAKEILCGNFVVSSADDKVRIVPTAVELYYHEENGEIKDPIVYHRGDRQATGIALPLLKGGILHSHGSGIDIAFEFSNGNRVCRASALIREFSVVGGINDEAFGIRRVDGRSTYFPKALLGEFDIFRGFSIKWEDSDRHASIAELHCSPRIGMKNGVEAGRKWNFRLNMKDEYTC